MSYKSVDRFKALQHLYQLGYRDGDLIHLRLFDPNQKGAGGRKFTCRMPDLPWRDLNQLQSDGFSLYVVVNGGGHCDAEVTQGRAIFYEHDDLPRELQLHLYKSLNLPVPTFQIDTGGKSIHSYWVFEHPVPIEEWRQLQADLLAYADADKSIKNPSRVMRLAGSWHTKRHPYTPVEMVTASKQCYSWDTLRSLIPRRPDPNQPKTTELPKLQTQPTEPIQLIRLLSLEHRQLIERGVSSGSRNTTAHTIARDAIGAEQWARSERLALDCTAWDLVQTFGSRCSPPLDKQELQQLFQSALKTNPHPCLSEDKLRNCISAQSSNPSTSTSTSRSNPAPADPPTQTLKEQLEILAEKSLDPATRQAILFDLAKLYGCRPREVEQLLETIEATRDYQDDLATTAASFDQLLNLEAKRLDLHRVLPRKLADPILATAASMPTTAAALFTTFIPTAASRIGSTSRVIVKASSGYIQPCIFRTTLVANTGDRKTPTQKAIIDPLYALETQAYDRWKAQQEAYEKAVKEALKKNQDPPIPPPPRQRYIINDATLEAKIRIHSDNPRGLLDYTDELAGRFTRMNKYRGGNGDDMQQDLSEFNGSAISKDRTRESIYLPRSAISSTGSIQYETLRELQEKAGKDDHAGVWARWLFCVEPMPPPFLNLTGPDADLDTGLAKILEALYYALGQLPQKDYLLSKEAKARFERWQHKMVIKHQTESIPVLKAAYPKMEAYAVRMALLLHLVWAVTEGREPAPSISEEMMGKALHVVNYYLSQLRLLISYNGLHPQTQLEGSLLKIKTLLDQKETLSARDIQRGPLRHIPAQQIKDLMALLAEKGFGQLEGTGSRLRLTKSVAPVSEVSQEAVTVSPTSEPQSSSEIEGIGSIRDTNVSQPKPTPGSQYSWDSDPLSYGTVASPIEDPVTGATVVTTESETQQPQGMQPQKSVTAGCDGFCGKCDSFNSCYTPEDCDNYNRDEDDDDSWDDDDDDNSDDDDDSWDDYDWEEWEDYNSNLDCFESDTLEQSSSFDPELPPGLEAIPREWDPNEWKPGHMVLCRSNWLPEVGTKVKYLPGWSPLRWLDPTEYTVVSIEDPIGKVVRIQGRIHPRPTKVSCAIIYPAYITGGG